MPGVILGTAPYLSPEQARGKAVDRRTDIWSFGCVLFECLTGRRAFEGETVSDVIAAILSREVEWARLPRATPPALRALLERCFEKDPRKRLRDIGDARLALEEIRDGRAPGWDVARTAAPRTPVFRSIGLAVALAVVSAAAGIALWSSLGPGRGQTPAEYAVRRLAIPLPSEIQWGGPGGPFGETLPDIVISPDGRWLVAIGTARTNPGEPAARPRLYRRRIDGDRFEEVAGAEGIGGFQISPDGRWVYFLAPVSERAPGKRLVKIPLEGGVAPVAFEGWDPSYVDYLVLEDGDVLAVSTAEPRSCVRLHADGSHRSQPVPIVNSGGSGLAALVRPLPAGRGVLVNTSTVAAGEAWRGTAVLDPATGRVKPLLREGANAAYLETGHLLFTRRSELLAVRFDLRRLEVLGEPIVVADGLRCGEVGSGQDAVFSVSGDGSLAYSPGGNQGLDRRLIVVDGRGRVSDWSRERTHFIWRISASPDGGQVACTIPTDKGRWELWVSDRGGSRARRLLPDSLRAFCQGQEFSPDGRQIAYNAIAFDGSDSAGVVYVQPSDGLGPARPILRDSTAGYTQISWSRDRTVLLATRLSSKGEISLVRIPIPGPGDSLSRPAPLTALQSVRRWRAVFSPTGPWVAYTSDESGRDEIYVARYREDGSLGPGTLASSGGGFDPRWSRSGRALFYESPLQRRIMSVALEFEPTLRISPPVERWRLDDLRVIDTNGAPYDMLPGDEMVAIQMGESEGPATRVEVVLNFLEDLKQKLRATRPD
jgi:serine/threonine-protein kinase